jgi:hypothetical protein
LKQPRRNWVTVFLSELKTSKELSRPVLIETMTRHLRGTVCDVNEEADYIVVQTPKTMGDKSTVTTVPMAEIVSVTLNG